MHELLNDALQAGFTHVGALDPKTIALKEDVREMCAQDLCGKYGKSWSCPPGCGTLEELGKIIHGYETGILVQTVAQLEDGFDFETMAAAEQAHKKTFTAFYRVLRDRYPNVLALGAGFCTVCAQCTYPDAPCRFPAEKQVSMEACGIVVSQVLKDNGMAYHYGKNTISYTSCYLL